MFLDGVMEYPAQTAAMLAPYLDEDGRPTDNRGDLYVKPARRSASWPRRSTALDWQVHSHAIGDRAVRVALDGYAQARTANGDRGLRHTITHLELVHPSDYGRFAELGVVASMQLQWALRNAFTLASLQPYIGQERFRRLYPAASLARAGAVLAGGSDWPVDPLRPFTQIATAVDRTGPDADRPPLGRRRGADPRPVPAHAHRGSAYQLHHGNSGTVPRPGRRADLIVLDRDITRVPVKEIRATRSSTPWSPDGWSTRRARDGPGPSRGGPAHRHAWARRAGVGRFLLPRSLTRGRVRPGSPARRDRRSRNKNS